MLSVIQQVTIPVEQKHKIPGFERFIRFASVLSSKKKKVAFLCPQASSLFFVLSLRNLSPSPGPVFG